VHTTSRCKITRRDADEAVEVGENEEGDEDEKRGEGSPRALPDPQRVSTPQDTSTPQALLAPSNPPSLPPWRRSHQSHARARSPTQRQRRKNIKRSGKRKRTKI